jgi:hypothetical protein
MVCGYDFDENTLSQTDILTGMVPFALVPKISRESMALLLLLCLTLENRIDQWGLGDQDFGQVACYECEAHEVFRKFGRLILDMSHEITTSEKRTK